MATKASDQITIVDLTDGYAVNLTNDSYTFAGDLNGKVSSQQSTTTVIQALRGSEVPTISVDTTKITKPSGITVSYAANTQTLTITASTSVAAGGTVTIPVLLDGAVTINKVFSFAIAKTGQTGAAGRGISSTVIEYQVGTSGTSAPTGTWSSSPVATTAQGQYLWTRTTVKYTSGSDTISYSVAAHGTTGSQGPQGDAGRGISSTTIEYQVGTSATSAPTGTWKTTPQATTAAGQYLWTRTTVKYTSGSDSVSYSVAAHGATGQQGPQGNAGADAITMVITSSGGTIFKNSDIVTTLTAHVYKAGVEVTGTALAALGTIKWYKDGGTTAAATGAELSISAGDVTNKASYEARLEA